MPGAWYQKLMDELQQRLSFDDQIEITMEANPGTLEHHAFEDYLKAGINRLSFGVQSFDNDQLQTLGRIHSSTQASQAYERARAAGYRRINLDIMFGLPNQSLEAGLSDLKQALALAPDHISWYQLTIEPNTVFYNRPPVLDHDVSAQLWQEGRALLASHGFDQYEVSAYAKTNQACLHNLAYWEFKDYLAIGAGAHGKYTGDSQTIQRYHKSKQPKDYLSRLIRLPTTDKPHPFIAQSHLLAPDDLVAEYLINRMRLFRPLSRSEFENNTLVSWRHLLQKAKPLVDKGCLTVCDNQLQLTTLGQGFLNEVLIGLIE